MFVIEFLTLVLALFGLWILFGIIGRTTDKLAVSLKILFVAVALFGLIKIVEILEIIGVFSFDAIVVATFYALFAFLMVVSLWKVLRCVKFVDGEIETKCEIKIKKTKKKH